MENNLIFVCFEKSYLLLKLKFPKIQGSILNINDSTYFLTL